jgi:protein-disulfide isomerase
VRSRNQLSHAGHSDRVGHLACLVVLVAAFLAAAVAGTFVIPRAAYAQGAQGAQTKTSDADIDPLSRAGDARAVGPDTAHVIVLEFFDFSCPVCQVFHATRHDSLLKAVGPDVRVAYVTYLITTHLRGFHAAEAAVCASVAGGQKAYAGMSDRLFLHSSEWAEAFDPGPAFIRYAREIGVDTAAFGDCRARDAAAPLILTDLEMANKFAITGTPTFIVIPRGATSADQALRISGNVPISELMKLVVEARAKAK